jgi:hypothetical protein
MSSSLCDALTSWSGATQAAAKQADPNTIYTGVDLHRHDIQLSQLASTMSQMSIEHARAGDSDEAMASLYERLVLYSEGPTPAGLEELHAAYHRVHLRGLDPLRKNQS